MASHERLQATLTELGEKDLSIKDVILIKFGSIMLAEVSIPENSQFPVSDKIGAQKPTYKLPIGIVDQIHAALKDHPNIFEPELILKREESFWGGQFGLFAKGDLYRYRVHLPKAKQKYDDMNIAEHFSVLCGGSVFAAYMNVEREVPIWSNIGHEFRELARSQIEKETQFKAPALGPCPIHLDVVLVVRDSEQSRTTATRRYHHENDIFIVTSDKVSIADLVVLSFLEFQGSIDDFYELQCDRKDLLESQEEVDNHFLAAINETRQLLETPSWKIWKTHAISRRARVSIASVHERLVELESGLMSHSRQQKHVLENIKKNPNTAAAHDYFKEMTDPEVNLPSSLAAALGYCEGELQLYGNIRSLLYASLIGAIVGALLSGLVARFIH